MISSSRCHCSREIQVEYKKVLCIFLLKSQRIFFILKTIIVFFVTLVSCLFVSRALWLVDNRHMWWQELSDWTIIATCDKKSSLIGRKSSLLLDNWREVSDWSIFGNVDKQKCEEKHQLNWKAKRRLCQSTFFYSNWIPQEQWHHEDEIKCHRIQSFLKVSQTFETGYLYSIRLNPFKVNQMLKPKRKYLNYSKYL